MTVAAKTAMWRGTALIVLSAMFFAVNVIAARINVGHGPPVLMGCLRSVIAAAVLITAFWPTLYRHRDSLLRDWKIYLVLGTCGTALNATPVYVGAAYTTGTNIALVSAVGPIFVAIGSYFVLRVHMSAVQMMGTGLAIIGVAVIILRGDLAQIAALHISFGDLTVVVGNAFWAVYGIGLMRFRSPLPPLARLAAMYAGGLPLIIVAALVEFAISTTYAPDTSFFLTTLMAALFTGVGAFAAHAQATQYVGATRAALAMYLVPLASVLLTTTILGESVEGYHVVGGGLTLVGVWLANRTAKARGKS
jgi:drug/metabolite transporter (DMT)-like permease